MHPEVLRITQEIASRSRALRSDYLREIDHMASQPLDRRQLSCGNLAHGVASCSGGDKEVLKLMESANVGVVTAYNDMLSAQTGLIGTIAAPKNFAGDEIGIPSPAKFGENAPHDLLRLAIGVNFSVIEEIHAGIIGGL